MSRQLFFLKFSLVGVNDSYIGLLLIDINGVDDGQSCNIVLYVKAELRILLL